MAFITGAIMGLATIGSGIIASKGAKKSASTAAAAQDRSLELQRESRDIALEHQRPYREAGYTALDALMSMTGLGAGVSRPRDRALTGSNTSQWMKDSPAGFGGHGQGVNTRWSSWGMPSSGPYLPNEPHYTEPLVMRAHGGGTKPGNKYNINELGPENVYRRGKVFRNSMPATIDGETGYVEPNIESRYMGGPMFGGAIGEMVKPIVGGGQQGLQNKIVNNDPPRMNYTKPAYTQRDATGAPIENPGGVEGGFNYQMDPGYNFRFEEGQRALERGAAARGGLLSGGFARKAIRYGQDYASGEYANVYNRIANIAGLGQVANTQSSNAALYAGQGMGQAAANSGYALASGQMAGTNAWANTVNQLGQLPWGEIFNKQSVPTGSMSPVPQSNSLTWFGNPKP